MTAFLVSVFGDNWRTTLFGLVQLIAGTAVNVIQSMPEGSAFNWSVFVSQCLVTILSFIAKDSKVTGGKVQAAAPGTLPSTTEAGKPEAPKP